MDFGVEVIIAPDIPTEASPTQLETDLPEYVSANGLTEETMAQEQSGELAGWLHTIKSVSRRSRKGMRTTNPLAIVNKRRDQSE